ncbi:hypothetical protein GCM10010486_20200 [Nonomuraea roseoviolacea subsp. carminata]
MTGWRAEHEWLAGGASVPQQHIIRDFARSRTKAVKDIKARLPFKRRAGMPRFKRSCPLIPRRFASTATPSGTGTPRSSYQRGSSRCPRPAG